MICIDANVAIGSMKGAPVQLVGRFDAELQAGNVALPSIVLHELWFGAANSRLRAKNEKRLTDFLASPLVVLPFDENDARHAGDIRAHLKAMGTPIGPYDVLIAAQARARGAILATLNVREFARVPGLNVEDWTS